MLPGIDTTNLMTDGSVRMYSAGHLMLMIQKSNYQLMDFMILLKTKYYYHMNGMIEVELV